MQMMVISRAPILYEIDHITHMRYESITHMRLECALTQFLISDSPKRMGRKKQWAEDMQARFAEGTFARIATVLAEGEARMDFVREAVERELKRRERKSRSSEPTGAYDREQDG